MTHEKKNLAIKPAIIGSIALDTNLTMVNSHPKIPISKGSLIIAQRDQEVMKATVVPIPAPE